MFTLLAFAFVAGFITILSPCILSIAPILLGAGTQQSRYKPLGIITGLIVSFSFFTLTLTAIVQATGISPDIFRYIAIVVIIFFGLTMIIPSLNNAFTAYTARIAHLGSTIEQESAHIKTDFFSGLLLGVALGLLWTPCAGPVLATITALAATGGITLTAVLITLAYSLGAALPMLAICFGGEKILHSATSITPYTETIRKVFGVLIITSALGIAFHVDTVIQEKIAHWFPTITIEKNKRLQKELIMLNNPQKTALRGANGAKAEELVGISEWLNSKPLTLAELRGKVVLLDFWTYTCINCIRTLPHLVEWYNTYKDHGFEIIGVHTPEFAFEKNKSHVEDAIKRFNITYPVALDNDYKTWRAYDNHYWPAHYLIDQNGIIVKTHFGEGNYTEMENAICALLKLPACTKKEEQSSRKALTPETYLGFERGDKYHPSLSLQKNIAATYQHVNTLGNDQIGLTGLWIVKSDCIVSQDNSNSLELNFIANHVYLVMKAEIPQEVTILLDGKSLAEKYYTKDMNTAGKIVVHAPRAYEVVDLKNDYGRHTLTLQCPAEITAYVFTFGS